MDPSGESVPPGPNHRRNGTFNFFTVLLKVSEVCVQSERVLNIFDMVISGMKTQFYT